MISWLRLEQYALGELPAAEAAEVERAIAGDPETRACLAEIEAGGIELPALLPAPAPVREPRWRRWLVWGGAGGLVAAAAALLLVILLDHREGAAPGVTGIKGGDAAVELVRERDGSVAYDPSRFASGDRFQVLVTCPPEAGATRARVTVRQAGQRFAPIAEQAIACGNRVTLGAFRITGRQPATVCVELDGADDATCVTLQPAR